jgi:hypothetical protein
MRNKYISKNLIYSLLDGLVNYWPIQNNVDDIVGCADMYNGKNIQYTNDRFGSSNSAISLIDGYYQVPAGVYFKGDLTISLWIRLRAQVAWAKIVDFGNGAGMENVIISASFEGSGCPAPEILNANSKVRLISSTPLNLGAWTHLVFTLNGTLGSIYLNGTLTAQNSIYVPNNVIRSPYYIGKSHWPDGNLNADLDDLRFYNRSITPSEKFELWNTTSTAAIYRSTATRCTTSRSPTTTQSTASSASSFISSLISTKTSNKTVFLNFERLNLVQIVSLLNSNYDLNGCILNCSNKGLCKFDLFTNKYICLCKSIYSSGYACQIDTRPCSSNPCLNNATCVDYLNHEKSNSSSFRCECDKYHRGTNCESEIDICQNETCSSNGNCYNLNNKAKCKCFSMYSGEKCELESNELKTNKLVISYSTKAAILIVILFYSCFVLMDISTYLCKKHRGHSVQPKKVVIMKKYTYISKICFLITCFSKLNFF